MNGSIYTYEMGPLHILMEFQLLELMKDLIGWSTVDGFLTPGGSMANTYSILTARHNKFPDVKNEGLFGLP
jgi:glutamate/tyrosine decarboxylase-like PLP-dependent enzyme